MTNPDIQEQAIEAMIAFNAAVKTLHLYPITNPSALNSIAKAFRIVSDALEITAPLVFAESEKRLIISGQPLAKAGGKEAQVKAFLQLLLDFEIKDITIHKGVEQAEFEKLLEFLGKSPKAIRSEGGLKQAVAGLDMPHISLDEKIYVSLEEGQMVADEGAVAGGKVNVVNFFKPMITVLDDILTPETKKEVARGLADYIVDEDDEFLLSVLTQQTQGEMGEELISRLIDTMDEDRFDTLAIQVKEKLEKEKAKGENGNDPDLKILVQNFQKMLRTDKGKQLQQRLKEEKAREAAQKKKEAAFIKSALEGIHKGNISFLKDKRVANALPGTVGTLFANNREKIGAHYVMTLGKAMVNKDPDIRQNAAHALVLILDSIEESLDVDRRNRMFSAIIRQLCVWISAEKTASSDFRKISAYLKELAIGLMNDGRFSDCAPVFKTLNHVGYVRDIEECRAIARNTLKEIAGEDILTPLLADSQSGEEEKRKVAAERLVQVGGPAAELLLTTLKDSEDKIEQRRLVEMITRIGKPAFPAIKDHIAAGEPLSYMRHLIQIIDKTGDASHAELLSPLLIAKDQKIQRECLNIIYRIGEDTREDILLDALPSADDVFKTEIIRMLARLKSKKATPRLLELLDLKKLSLSKTGIKLGETICTTLGYIGDPEALDGLSEISEQKGLLSKTSGAKTIQSAAGKAVALIKQNLP